MSEDGYESGEIETSLHRAFVTPGPLEEVNVADALLSISISIDRLAEAVRRLGNADAATPMGGLEAFGKVMKEGFARLSSAIANGD